MARAVERVGDRGVGQRRREEQRAIAELAVEVAPDVLRQHRVGLEDPQHVVHRARARQDAPVDLADDDGAAIAAQDPPRRQPVRAVVDEAAHRARLADMPGDDEFVEAVLRREDEAVLGEMRGDVAHRRVGVVRLDGEDDAAEPALDLARHEGAQGTSGELLHGPLDREASRAHRRDMVGGAVEARAHPGGADRAADRAGAPEKDGIAHFGHGPSMSARVSSTATRHISSTFSSGSSYQPP